jgi:hypothetical protein
MSSKNETKTVSRMPDNSCPDPGFFYIIQTPDVETGVYKIGKTTQTNPNKRLCAYPTYSSVKYTIAVNNADLFEDIVMRKFKILFKRRMEHGLEYYEGDLVAMIEEVHNLWIKYNNINSSYTNPIKLDKSIEKIKPNGWQYFVNEWLSKNTDSTVDIAYEAYVDIIKKIFMSNEYAEKPVFTVYFNAMSM